MKLSLPVMLGAFAQFLILIADARFLSEYDTNAFSGVGNAGLIYITFYMIGVGIADAGQIFMARRYGEDNMDGIKAGFQSNLITLLKAAAIMFVLVHCIRLFLLPELVHSKAIGHEMDQFLGVRIAGFFFSFVTLSITSYFLAIGRSRILIYNMLIFLIINVGLNYLLIFGHYGFPEMGTQGAAIATLIAEGCVCLFSISYLWRDRASQQQQLLKAVKYSKEIGKRIFKVALPLMLQGFVAVAAWTTYFLMIEQMGTQEIEVSQIIHKLYWLALVPIYGISAATKTYVSNLLATGDHEKVRQVVKRLLLVIFVFVGLTVHGNLLYPEFWIEIVYNPEFIDPHIIKETRLILSYITGSIFIHTAASVFQNVISGSGDTIAALKLEFVSIVIYLICSYLAIFEWELDIVQVWLLEYVYFIVFLSLTLRYYLKGKWKTNQV